MDTKLSIIIPVYNVEKYLEKCIESFLCQNLDDCEIILVDDGSTDSSSKICDNYKKNSKVCVFHKKNGGLSDARNYGLKLAKGKYVWFVDSDDFVEDGCINKIIKLIDNQKSEVIVCQSKTINDDGVTKDECIYSIAEKKYSNSEYMNALKNNPKSVLFCAQYHICNREYILKNKIFFFKGIIHEDELWTPQVLMNAKYIYYSSLNIYYHYMRSDSIMHSSKLEKSGACDLFISEELIKIFDNSGRKDLSYLRDRAANVFLQSVWKIPDFTKQKNLRRSLAIKNAYYIKSKIKSFIYFFSPRLYLIIHSFFK